LFNASADIVDHLRKLYVSAKIRNNNALADSATILDVCKKTGYHKIMKVRRALKVRLYPTPEQAIFLNKMLGRCCFLYNHAEWIHIYEVLKDDTEALRTHHYMTKKDYKALFEFLKEMNAFVLPQAQRNLESAYASFFNSLKREAISCPKFKVKTKQRDSYQTRMSIYVDIDNQTIKLPTNKKVVLKVEPLLLVS
jgi:putative transposase